jgi:hypothetical protein
MLATHGCRHAVVSQLARSKILFRSDPSCPLLRGRPHGRESAGRSARFRDLHTRYPVADLAEALADDSRTSHPSMPEFQLGPDQVEDVIRYLTSLER